MLLPSVPRGARSRPLPAQVVPRHGPFLRAESCLAEGTPPDAVRVAPAVDGPHHYCSWVAALGTGHKRPPSLVSSTLWLTEKGASAGTRRSSVLPAVGKTSRLPIADFGLDSFNADSRAAELNAGSFRGISKQIRSQVNLEFQQWILNPKGRAYVFRHDGRC